MKKYIEIDGMETCVDFGSHSRQRLSERVDDIYEVLNLLVGAEDILYLQKGESFIVEDGTIGFIGSVDSDSMTYENIIDCITVIRADAGKKLYYSKELTYVSTTTSRFGIQ